MESIGDWLTSFGLGAHASSFIENLTDQNLKDLGVAIVGQRVKFLRPAAGGVGPPGSPRFPCKQRILAEFH